MLQLPKLDLESRLQDVLDQLQKQIDIKTRFATKVKRAKELWGNKGNATGKRAFDEIKQALYSLTVFEGVCNYCEQSEASDIEHINPKSFFPGQAFVFENYILACKQCNTGLKLDKCYIYDEHGTLNKLKRKQEPMPGRVAFLNPRVDITENFIILNPITYNFIILPNLSDFEKAKAKQTIEILQLNSRPLLTEARKVTEGHYYDKISRLIDILGASSKDEIRSLLNPIDNRIDFSKSISTIKEELTQSYKNHIIKYQHPSVWYMIKKVKSRSDDQWESLFNTLPELNTW